VDAQCIGERRARAERETSDGFVWCA